MNGDVVKFMSIVLAPGFRRGNISPSSWAICVPHPVSMAISHQWGRKGHKWRVGSKPRNKNSISRKVSSLINNNYKLALYCTWILMIIQNCVRIFWKGTDLDRGLVSKCLWSHIFVKRCRSVVHRFKCVKMHSKCLAKIPKC